MKYVEKREKKLTFKYLISSQGTLQKSTACRPERLLVRQEQMAARAFSGFTSSQALWERCQGSLLYTAA